MMAPLVPLALVYGRATKKVRDPLLTLRLGSHVRRIGAEAARRRCLRGLRRPVSRPGTVRQLGDRAGLPGDDRVVGAQRFDYVDEVPNFIFLPVLAAALFAFAWAAAMEGVSMNAKS